MKRFLSVVALLSVIAVVGCYAKREVTPPETFPVSGTVVSSQPIPNGYQIDFTAADPEKNASAPIGPDGSFKLTTRYLGVTCEGAAPGSYTVSLLPPIGLLNSGVMPYTLPQKIQIDAPVTDLKIPFPGR